GLTLERDNLILDLKTEKSKNGALQKRVTAAENQKDSALRKVDYLEAKIDNQDAEINSLKVQQGSKQDLGVGGYARGLNIGARGSTTRRGLIQRSPGFQGGSTGLGRGAGIDLIRNTNKGYIGRGGKVGMDLRGSNQGQSPPEGGSLGGFLASVGTDKVLGGQNQDAQISGDQAQVKEVSAIGVSGSQAIGVSGIQAKGVLSILAKGVSDSQAKGVSDSHAKWDLGSQAKGVLGDQDKRVLGGQAKGVSGQDQGKGDLRDQTQAKGNPGGQTQVIAISGGSQPKGGSGGQTQAIAVSGGSQPKGGSGDQTKTEGGTGNSVQNQNIGVSRVSRFQNQAIGVSMNQPPSRGQILRGNTSVGSNTASAMPRTQGGGTNTGGTQSKGDSGDQNKTKGGSGNPVQNQDIGVSRAQNQAIGVSRNQLQTLRGNASVGSNTVSAMPRTQDGGTNTGAIPKRPGVGGGGDAGNKSKGDEDLNDTSQEPMRRSMRVCKYYIKRDGICHNHKKGICIFRHPILCNCAEIFCGEVHPVNKGECVDFHYGECTLTEE
ncbi:unnamed protein product, partial [Meganyctiphanes norvegica]